MESIIQRFFGWCKSLFRSDEVKSSPRPKFRRGNDIEQAGQWYFKRDILDKLDEYLVCIKRMKKTDPDGYAFYRRIGAMALPAKTMLHTGLSPRWKKRESRPAFGAIALLGDDLDDDFYGVKFGYFKRLDRVPPRIEPTNGQIYQVVLFYNRADDDTARGRLSTFFYISIGATGAVTPLRFADTKTQTIHHKDRSSKGRVETTKIYHKAWTYGFFLETHEALKQQTRDELASKVFSIIATGYEHAAAALRVSATKGNITASFGIDMLRTPYFFEDRDHTHTDTGRKRRIFHIVKTHKRIMADGRESNVKSHFRGERRFSWNGYDVIVSMPGKHHADLLDASFGSHEYEADETFPDGFVSEKSAVDMMAAHLKQ